MRFIPVLQFDGTCAAAMTRYAQIFGAGRLSMLRYFEAPPEAQMPPSDRVMMAEMQVGDAVLRAMDFPPGRPGEPQGGTAVNWSLPDEAAAGLLFDLLAEGGWVILPFRPLFGGRHLGLVRDRFGTHWMIGAPDFDPAAFDAGEGGAA